MARSPKGRAWLLPLVATVGCGEKVIEMKLVLPEDHEQWDTSCLKTIELFTGGANYPTISTDYLGQTLDTADAPPTTYLDVEDVMRGQFLLDIPDSGLSGIELYGWDGPSGFFVDPAAGLFPDMVFYSYVPYSGQDEMRVEIVPNLDCRLRPVTVRPIDMLTLLQTKDCAMAAITDPNAGVGMGTLTPGLFRDYMFGWGGQHGSLLANGVAVFSAPLTAGPESCVAVYSGDARSSSGGCVTGERVCAGPNEIETTLVDNLMADNAADPAIEERFRGIVFVAVVDNTKTPIAGATVTVDEEIGQVVFGNVDTVARRFTAVGGEQTTASGTFILYTSTLAEVTITAPGRGTKTLTLGGQRRTPQNLTLPAGVIVTL
jgi:hypothetical protein